MTCIKDKLTHDLDSDFVPFYINPMTSISREKEPSIVHSLGFPHLGVLLVGGLCQGLDQVRGQGLVSAKVEHGDDLT